MCALEINKTNKGWSCKSLVKYPGFPTNETFTGYSTLKSALWQVIDDLRTLPHNPELTHITVNGKELSKADALRIIIDDLSGTPLDYTIPRYIVFLSGD